MTDKTAQLGDIIECLPKISGDHSRTNSFYKIFETLSKNIIANSQLSDEENGSIQCKQYGKIKFPFVEMGKINSLDLFGLDELIIFSFYWHKRNLYHNVTDIGANLGLHSIIMALSGWKVVAYEPDPKHVEILVKNLRLNKVENNVDVRQEAVSSSIGKAEFVRVLGNTTSSHISGSKQPYGDLEKFEVKLQAIPDIMEKADFIKMDVEGHEADIFEASKSTAWEGCEMILEVGSPENAKRVFMHSKNLGLKIFSQKIGWNLVKRIDEMPINYKEGSIFVTTKETMWN